MAFIPIEEVAERLRELTSGDVRELFEEQERWEIDRFGRVIRTREEWDMAERVEALRKLYERIQRAAWTASDETLKKLERTFEKIADDVDPQEKPEKAEAKK